MDVGGMGGMGGMPGMGGMGGMGDMGGGMDFAKVIYALRDLLRLTDPSVRR